MYYLVSINIDNLVHQTIHIVFDNLDTYEDMLILVEYTNALVDCDLDDCIVSFQLTKDQLDGLYPIQTFCYQISFMLPQ